MSSGDELRLLAQSTRRALEGGSEWPPEEPDDSWTQAWGRIEELGLLDLFCAGGSIRDAVAVHEEAGRRLFAGPLLAAHGADWLLAAAGVDEAPERLLLARTPGRVTVGDGTVSARLELQGDVDGAAWVVWSEQAEQLLRVQPDRSAAQVPQRYAFDTSRRQVVVDVVDLTAHPLGVPDERGAVLRDVLALLSCADSVGALQRAVTMTVDYAKERETFGSPIAKNQAVAFPLVRHSATVLQVRLVVHRAAEALDEGSADASGLVLAAQSLLAQHGVHIISECVQLSGGIGFTWEWGLHHLLRRVAVNVGAEGGAVVVHERVAAAQGWLPA